MIWKGNAPINWSVMSTATPNLHRIRGDDSVKKAHIKNMLNVNEVMAFIRT